MNKAVFLDRDGVINKWEEPQGEARNDGRNWYCLSWDDWKWADGSIEGLKLLAETDYKLIVVSNQSCIGCGLAYKLDIDMIFQCMCNDADDHCACGDWEIPVIDDYYFCHHTPADYCACRKPRPGMIYQAAIEHEIDLRQSWLIGDRVTDGMAARGAGIHTRQIIACRDEPRGWFFDEYCFTRFAPNLLESAKIIVEKNK